MTVGSELGPRAYLAGVKVSDAHLGTIQLERAAFHGDWSYTIRPHTA